MGVGGCLGEIASFEVDEVPADKRDCPMLLSKAMLTKLRASIHLYDMAVDFAAMGAYGMKWRRTSAGYAAIDLIDFRIGFIRGRCLVGSSTEDI